MPRFISNSGSFQDLIVTGSRLYVASSSIFFNNLVTSSTAPNVLLLDTNGQIYYTASSAFGGGTSTPTSFIATGSVSASVNVGTSSFQITSGSSTFMFVSSSGRVGIGTSSPTALLTLSGSGTTNATTVFRVNTGNSSQSSSFYVKDDGSVGIPFSTLFHGPEDDAAAKPLRIVQSTGAAAYYGVEIGGANSNIRNITGGTSATVLGGFNTYETGSNLILIGQSNTISSSMSDVILIGRSNIVSGSTAQSRPGQIIVGNNNRAGSLTNTQVYGIIIGNSNDANGYYGNGLIGNGLKYYGNNQLVFGAQSQNIDFGLKQVWFGYGVQNENDKSNSNANFGRGASVSINVSRAYSGSAGSDIDGGNLTLNGGQGTGTGSAGDVIIGTPITGSTGTTHHTQTNRVWVKGHTGNVMIGTSTDTNYKLMVSGSGTSGSLNVDNILFISASTVSISGSLTVVSGSTEFQVLNTGIKMGNTGSDTHTMTGSFGVQVAPVGSNLPGGITVTNSPNNVDYATNFTIGNYTIVAQRTPAELFFSASSTAAAGPYLIGTQMYFGQTSPRLIFGGAQGPFNASYMSVGVNTGSEYANGLGYLSGSNNFYFINTNLTTPSPSSNQRRPLYIGANEIRFFVSSSTNGDTFTSATPTMIITSGSNVRITGSTNVLTIQGSGSINPLFTVQGSLGELFSVTDNLSGSIFSVNDISGLPILDVNSDQTTKIGSYLAPGMYTSTRVTANTGITVIYSIPTASYDSAYFDYNIRSGSVGRAGQIMAMWSGSSVNYTEVSASSFGTTNTFVFGVSISGSNMILSGSAPTNGWIVKTIIKAI